MWDDQGADSTGAVSLTLMPSCELSPEKVGAIKNLIANSVPRLLPENVTVVNAETMQEMVSDDVGGLTSYGLGRLDFEAKVEKRLQDKIMNVLTLAYPQGQIRVSATVVIDYDKMITEDLQYEPQDNGQGVVDHYKSGQSVSGQGGGAAVWPGKKITRIFRLMVRQEPAEPMDLTAITTAMWIIWLAILRNRSRKTM